MAIPPIKRKELAKYNTNEYCKSDEVEKNPEGFCPNGYIEIPNTNCCEEDFKKQKLLIPGQTKITTYFKTAEENDKLLKELQLKQTEIEKQLKLYETSRSDFLKKLKEKSRAQTAYDLEESQKHLRKLETPEEEDISDIEKQKLEKQKKDLEIDIEKLKKEIKRHQEEDEEEVGTQVLGPGGIPINGGSLRKKKLSKLSKLSKKFNKNNKNNTKKYNKKLSKNSKNTKKYNKKLSKNSKKNKKMYN